jgi:hypothetical protein
MDATAPPSRLRRLSAILQDFRRLLLFQSSVAFRTHYSPKGPGEWRSPGRRIKVPGQNRLGYPGVLSTWVADTVAC